jgi:probable HAF family extracellular repeat protein
VDINNRGQVVGEYLDAGGAFHGFLYHKGRFTTIDFPGAVGSSPTGINDRGEIVGAHADPASGGVHGFLLKRGRFTSFDAPGVPITLPMDINNRGQIVGVTLLDVDLTGGRGFLLARGVKGGFSPLDYPGAPRTFAFGINDRRAIIGTYENASATSIPPAAAEPMGMSLGEGTF